MPRTAPRATDLPQTWPIEYPFQSLPPPTAALRIGFTRRWRLREYELFGAARGRRCWPESDGTAAGRRGPAARFVGGESVDGKPAALRGGVAGPLARAAPGNSRARCWRRSWNGSPTPPRTPAASSPGVAIERTGPDLLTTVGPLLGAQA